MTKRYSLTPEHRAQLGPWRERWRANALSTAPMDEAERATVKRAIVGLYRAADLTPPPEANIVFVLSPFIARFAGGFLAGAFEAGKRPNIAKVCEQVTKVAVGGGRDYDRWYGFPVEKMGDLGEKIVGDRAAALTAARDAHIMWNGGNQWSGYVTYLSFFRHVVKLPLDYSKWDHYEVAAVAGPRIMHERFCLVSERPELLTVDDHDPPRPHNAHGPYCRWRDGASLYAWHGTQVPRWVIDSPGLISAASIRKEANVEVRRAMIERIGWARYLTMAKAKQIQADDFGSLLECPAIAGEDEPLRLLRVTNSTPEPDGSFKDYLLRVPPSIESAKEGVAWSFGVTEAQRYDPVVQT